MRAAFTGGSFAACVFNKCVKHRREGEVTEVYTAAPGSLVVSADVALFSSPPIKEWSLSRGKHDLHPNIEGSERKYVFSFCYFLYRWM